MEARGSKEDCRDHRSKPTRGRSRCTVETDMHKLSQDCCRLLDVIGVTDPREQNIHVLT